MINKIMQKIKNNEDITIDFVGDSITYGMNYCRTEETYVAKFAACLSRVFSDYTVYRYDGIVEEEPPVIKKFDGPVLVASGKEKGKIDVVRNGVGGNTVVHALKRIDDFTGTLVNGKRPDITFMMFGINDALKSDPTKYVFPEEFKKNYKILIDEIRRRNDDTCIIMLSATYNDQTITEHCEKSRELAKEENIPYIDLHKLWMEHFDEDKENFGQGDWLAGGEDACHPMPIAAEITAKYIFDKFMALLEK